jgi:O-succinylbenzoate synthase|tara:strand:- start:1285 stop:2388 length:1104 start_codon:yes stop_codon:yes gene_type:complete
MIWHREYEIRNQVFCVVRLKKDGLIARWWIESQPMVEFEFKAYRRSFARAYQTASDSMRTRSGILIRLSDEEGRVGFGEAAPIESFGTESFVSALSACSSLKGEFEYESVIDGLGGHPCVRFGVEFALSMMEHEDDLPEVNAPWPVSALVPSVEDMGAVETFLEEGYRCLKFKIGTGDFAEERRALDRVFGLTGGEIGIRLDANGGLDLGEARNWLEYLGEMPVEFLEQPLMRGAEDTMCRLSMDYPTPIALDESIASVDDLNRCRDRHWEGLYVIKPSLSGQYQGLIESLKEGDPGSLVFSSSLETIVGTSAALSVAIEVGDGENALGFGVESLFGDRGVGLFLGPFLQRGALPTLEDFEVLWNRI